MEGAKRDAAEAVIAIIREAEVDRVSIEVRDDAGNTVGVTAASLKTAIC